MAVFTYLWANLPKTSLDPTYAATSADIDDIYVTLPEEAHGIIKAVTFSGGGLWNYHAHSGTADLLIQGRVKATGEWRVMFSRATTTGFNIDGISFTTAVFDEGSVYVDAIRLTSSPFQQTGLHQMGSTGNIEVTSEVKKAVIGGASDTGSGTGNMFGGFALGSTMLGADPGSGSGRGGSGIGNMLGGFTLGSTMLGADPGGGGGSDPAPSSGSVYQVQAAIAGAANVSGAFATFIWEVAGRPVGNAVVQNAYLNSNWALSATTVNPTGVTVRGTGSGTLTTTASQTEKSQTASFTMGNGGAQIGNFGYTGFRRPLNGGAETTISSTSGNTTATSRTFSYDAGEGFYVSRVTAHSGGGANTYLWEFAAEPQALVTSLLFSPIGLHSTVEAGATVSGDMSMHILDGADCTGEATVVANANRVVTTKPQLIQGNGQVVADLQNIKDLFADSVGEATVTPELVLTHISFGTSNVTGELVVHNTRGQSVGIATVVGNMRRNEGFQGDCIGDSVVVADPFLELLLASSIAGESTTKADLTYPAPLSGGTAVGDTSTAGLLAIYNLKGAVEGSSSATGHLRYDGGVTMSGRVAGEASLALAMRVRGVFGQQQINGDSTVTCPALIRVWFVDGKSSGDSTVTSTGLTIHTIPPSPILGDSTVVAHATHDARYGGEIVGEAVVKPTFPYVETTVGTGTSQGTTDVRGRLYVRPQDFDPSTSDGTAAVLGQILLTFLALNGKSVGGRHHKLTATGQFTEPPQYDDVLMRAYLSAKAPFAAVTIKGYAEFERAILLLNDSGLITGHARVDAFLDFKTGVGEGTAKGWSNNRGQFDFARDMSGTVTDAWTGVGKWFKGGFHRIYHFDFSLTMAPIKDIHPLTGEDHTGLPGNAIWHGASSYPYFGVRQNNHPTVDSYINGHVWDGTYDEWQWGVHVRGLDWRNYPEVIDPETRSPYRVMPGPLRRKYQLLQPGEAGTWMVDTRGPGFLDKSMRASPVGEARFDEPQSTVDMDLELKSSMRGRIFGISEVTAVALLLSFRSLIQEGNVTVLRHLTTLLSGNAAKSPEALLPMTRDKVDQLNPVRQSNAMYV